jgi:Transposase zinc-binding domain
MATGLEVAEVFRRHGETYRQVHADHLGRTERRVMGAIAACRTAALGGHAEFCEDCGLVRCAYNSCRNRHCPKCQGLARAEWLADRQAELLPVPYFHVVFTVPAQSHSRIRRRFTPFFSAPRPRRCARSPPIRVISAPRLASSR